MLGFSTVGWWLSTKLYMRSHGLLPRLDQACHQAEEGRQESGTLLTLAGFLRLLNFKQCLAYILNRGFEPSAIAA